MGALGLAINMRPSYPHLTHYRLRRHSNIVMGQLLEQARQQQVRLDATTMVWDTDRGSSPSRSLRSRVVGWINTLFFLSLSLHPYDLSIFYPYLMLTLDLSSNTYDTI